MEQKLIDGIKKEYEDISKLVSTNFAEEEEEFKTAERAKEIEEIRLKHSHYVTSEDIDVYDYILSDVTDEQLRNAEIGNTNKILMYISKLNYDTYKILFKDEIEVENAKSDDIFILFMDIEDNKKYFIREENYLEFIKTHNVIVPSNNLNINPGGNHYRNMQNLENIRKEFIKEAIYSNQEEAANQLIKKYQYKQN